MSESTQYAIGAGVRCREEPCGVLSRVVVDPVARTLTHLVVEPPGGPDSRRLVPIELVDAASEGDDIRLQCDDAGFQALEPAQETELLPAQGGRSGYAPDRILSLPYTGLASGTMGLGASGRLSGPDARPRTTTYDRVPAGEVQVRRGERLDATDGEAGQVKGLVVDPEDNGVTHVLLEEGHLWSKKVVGVPIEAVTHVGESISVELTKKELSGLPPVDLGDHG